MKIKVFAKKHIGWLLPVATMFWFLFFYLITRSVTVSSIGGLTVGFIGMIVFVTNLD